ncbi:MAG: DUF4870 domain-containing protein [Steroidobacteraceae bacterium]
MSSSDDRTLAIITPITAIFTYFLGPLIIYLIKKDEPDSMTLRAAREALNFQITLALVYMACGMAWFLVLPIFFLAIGHIVNFILCIVHAVKVSNGEDFRYPLTWRLIKD